MPADQDQVLKALRFGWAFAEARGRLHIGPPRNAAPAHRPGHALPLEDERTWMEQTIELEAIVEKLAGPDGVGVDFKVSDLSEQTGNGTASSRVKELSVALAKARTAGNEELISAEWEKASEFFYAWDAKIQDTLAPGSFSVASAYQLGRGLAEVYWALDPNAERGDPSSIEFLLGHSRRRQLSRLLTRLAGYFPASTASTVTTSLIAWGDVASDGLIHTRPRTVRVLHEQIRIWHDALLLEQALTTRVGPKALLTHARQIGPVLRAFVPEASVGLISLLLALGAAGIFAVGGVSHAVAPVLAVLSAFGITSAGALAKTKASAHAVFDQLQQAMTTDLVTRELTLEPARAYLAVAGGPVKKRKRERALQKLRTDDGAETSPAKALPASTG